MRRSRSIPADTGLARSSRAAKDLAALRRALLRWYDQHRRELPWRKTQDPYRIWLSEIMLQQTRVAAVLEHYRTFLGRFPNLQSLAAASEDAVLAAWSGLGYYRRARMLHRCAIELVRKRGGRFPQNAKDLVTLPGIGRYTAAAIASIAFAESIAVVDGNVERVLHRFTGVNLTPPQTWQHAQTLLASSRPGDFNQAMMELGAAVCLPREPKCASCPLQKWCATQKSRPGVNRIIRIDRRPSSSVLASTRIRQVKKEIWCLLSQGVRGIRLVQRPKQSSLMAGMWELPQSPEPPPTSPTSRRWRSFRHSITVTDYTVHVIRNMPLRNTPALENSAAAKAKWIAIDRIPQVPITGLTRKILRAGGII